MELRRQAFDQREPNPIELKPGRFRDLGAAPYFGGRTQLSDHARQQLEAGLPKRSIRNTFALAAAPFTESCALRAGTKVL